MLFFCLPPSATFALSKMKHSSTAFQMRGEKLATPFLHHHCCVLKEVQGSISCKPWRDLSDWVETWGNLGLTSVSEQSWPCFNSPILLPQTHGVCPLFGRTTEPAESSFFATWLLRCPQLVAVSQEKLPNPCAAWSQLTYKFISLINAQASTATLWIFFLAENRISEFDSFHFHTGGLRVFYLTSQSWTRAHIANLVPTEKGTSLFSPKKKNPWYQCLTTELCWSKPGLWILMTILVWGSKYLPEHLMERRKHLW